MKQIFKQLKDMYQKLIIGVGQSVTKHPFELEGLLRPPLELYSALFSFMAALLFFFAPEIFLMSSFYGFLAGLLFLVFALRRFCQGMYVKIYQKTINHLPFYAISANELHGKLAKKNALFSGRAIAWRNKHAQRFFDLEAIGDFEKYLEKKGKHAEFAEKVGGKPHIHGVGFIDEKDFYIDINDRIGHFLMYGQSRSGKSRALELYLEQDIMAGHMVVMIDPKGDPDLHKRVLIAAKRAGRLNDVMILHLGFTSESVRYNPVGNFQRISEVAGRISSKLPSSGDSQAFAQFAWRFIYVVAQAMEVIQEPITIPRIKRHVQELDHILASYAQHFLKMDEKSFLGLINNIALNEEDIPRHLQGKSLKTVKILQYFDNNNIDVDDILGNIINAYSYERTYYDKITASLLPFLEQLCALGDVISPEKDIVLPELQLADAIRKNKIICFYLDGLSDPMVAHALGAMFFADLVSEAGRLYKTQESFKPVIVHADEFNDVIGDDFIPLLNKAGGAGVIVNAYTQTDQDIDLGFGGSALGATKALVAKGNFRTIGIMRVATEETAKYFTQRLKDISVKYTITETRMTDSGNPKKGHSAVTSDSVKDKSIKLIEANTIMAQPVGQMFISKNGNHIYHVRFPLFSENLSQLVGSIEEIGLGNMIKAVNTGKFEFANGFASLLSQGNEHKDKKNKGNENKQNKYDSQMLNITLLDTKETLHFETSLDDFRQDQGIEVQQALDDVNDKQTVKEEKAEKTVKAENEVNHA
ncbi:conjugative transfer system coupling protein TraD [Cysteiniphilum litorale]|uniref:conjugative transfer system coupling protein TraD n=1 Tax=Cysteiniphilum litorale TaxID=2056700 RepID=UPI003F8814E7